MNPPYVRLAACSSRIDPVLRQSNWIVGGESRLPSMLFSYAYEKIWLPRLSVIQFRDFVIDSGAFTVHTLGRAITVEQFRDRIFQYRDEIGLQPREIFSLDVIGDWRGTKRNTEYLWSQGILAIPAFHYGEPEDVLIGFAADYPKIAIGGAVGMHKKEKERWARQCFARVWPKPIHGFGFGLWATEILPFHSVDCSDWEGGAARFGVWNSYKKSNLGLTRKQVENHLGSEVRFWLENEFRAQQRWRRTFSQQAWPENPGSPWRTL